MIRKTLSILIVLVFMLTGCNTKQANEINPFTFTILYNETEDNPYQEDWKVLEVYESERNATLDAKLGDNEDFEKAIELNLNIENPPDVILKCWPDTIEGHANEGKLLPISDYVNLMPNFNKYIENNKLESEIEKLKLKNGKYYILPGYQRGLQVQQWIYRQDIFEENNLTMPTTYDELFESLVVLKEKYPESTPITASWGGAHLLSMMGAGYGIPAGWSGTRYFNEEKNEWEYAPATENFRELYRFLNKCYTAGVLDEAFFDQSNEEFIEKLVNGKAFVTVTWISSGFDTWNNQLKENGIQNGEWEPLPVMESTIGIRALPPVSRFRKGLAISASAAEKPYFEDMIKFLDWAVYSEEVIDLTYWGIEELTYKNTPKGKEFLPEIISSKNPEGTINITKEYGFNTIFDLNEDEEFEDRKKPDDIVTFLSNSEKANETLENNPKLSLNEEELEMESIINEELSKYVDDASKKFITGELSIDNDWDMYISEIDSIGYTVLENIWNSAWTSQNQ